MNQIYFKTPSDITSNVYILLHFEIDIKLSSDMKAKIGKGDAEQINHTTQTEPDKVHVLKLWTLFKVQIRKMVAKIRYAWIFKSCGSEGIWPVLERLSYYEEIFNVKKGFPTSNICCSFLLWSLWWRKARWCFRFRFIQAVKSKVVHNQH